MKQPRPSALASLDAGIFSVSLAILLVELLLTRIFSVVMYHHFSFLAVSLAMSGIGLGGLLVTLLPRVFRRENLGVIGPILTLAFAAAVVLGAWIAFHTPIRLQETAENWRNLTWILVSNLAPFVLGGLVVAHILAFNAERAHRLYFFDLVGAGFACVLFVPLIRWLGAPSSLLVAAAVGILGGACLARRRPVAVSCVCLAVTVLALAGFNTTRGFFDLEFAKGGATAANLATEWNAFSRVEVRGVPGDMNRLRAPVSWGFSSTLRTTARELHLLYDADAMTQIVGFDGDLEQVRYLLADVTSAAHHLHNNPNVLVIGPGGGRDVLSALVAGSQKVTGVEINGVTVDLMRGQFKDYTSGLYADWPNVTIVVEDGRSFVQHSPDRYDLIQASLVDTWAASSAGAYALAENSLYTTEAFVDYLSKLTADGVVSFSRWYAAPPVEVMRLVVVARAALARVGVTEPAGHIAIVRTDSRMTRRPSLATVLVKRSPFTPAEIASLLTWTRSMLFDVAFVPWQSGAQGSEPAFATILGSDPEASAFLESVPFDLTATSDDRPFFFDRVPLFGWLKLRLGFSAPPYASGELPLASRTLLVAMIVTATNALVLITLPLLMRTGARRKNDRPPLMRRFAWIVYFACLGVGYIVVEIVLIQRLNLYLGNPAYALTVVLFTMLVSSGCGSLFAERWPRIGALVPMLVVVCLGVAFMRSTLNALVYGTLAVPTGLRIATAVAYVAPFAFAMGMPFPTGLRHAARVSESLVPWAWGVNGGMSVLGSVAAVVVSMTAGFSTSLLLGALAYCVALVVVLPLVRSAARS